MARYRSSTSSDILAKVLGGAIVAVIAVAIAFLLSVILAFPVKWLWNSTVVELFSFPAISVWMAWKISFLSGLLFKSSSSATKSDKD